MKYFIIIWAFIILLLVWVFFPKRKKEEEEEESDTEFHAVEEESPVPHTHNDSLSKFVKKIKDKAEQKKEAQSDKSKKDDDYTPYQPPCGTCAPSCSA